MGSPGIGGPPQINLDIFNTPRQSGNHSLTTLFPTTALLKNLYRQRHLGAYTVLPYRGVIILIGRH